MEILPKSSTRFITAVAVTLIVGFIINNAHANTRLNEVKSRITSNLVSELAKGGLKLGDDVYLRAYKADRELEVWMKPEGKNNYKLFKTYKIAGGSGVLGPKLAEGDRQMPEGFYTIVPSALNPNSRYHLSFNIGYPNSYDRYHKRTGSFIMVHGSNVSIGCYAMTDPVIEVIYLLVEADLKKGDKKVPFHSYPFRYKRNWETKVQGNQWIPFWKHLETAHQAFDKTKVPPQVSHRKGQYHISAR